MYVYLTIYVSPTTDVNVTTSAIDLHHAELVVQLD